MAGCAAARQAPRDAAAYPCPAFGKPWDGFPSRHVCRGLNMCDAF